MKKVKISEIAKFLSASYYGENYSIQSIKSLDNIEAYSLAFSKKSNFFLKCKALVLVPLEFSYNNTSNYTVIKVFNPRLAFAKVLQNFFVEEISYKIDISNFISEGCSISKNVSMGRNCFIGQNVAIEEGTILKHNIVIGDNTSIGRNCYIKSGAIIGEEGFGFDFEEDGTPVRIPHIGNVKIGNNVEIGANTVIAKGTLGSTIIQDDVKIDDQVFIAHNCTIGEKTMIIAFAQISGSVHIGQRCWIAPNVSIIQKVHIGDNVTIGIGAVVTKDIESNKKIMGLEGLELRPLMKLKRRIDYGK